MRSISSRLNAWQRLAVVITVLWLVVGTYHFWFAQVDANYSTAALFKKMCEEAHSTEPAAFVKCDADYGRDMDRYGGERWGLLGATFALNVIATAAFWVAAFIAFRIGRWILAGRHVISN